jgi:4-hydroxyproline epimerase
VSAERVRVVDSHTGGEPTRLVLEGGPELGAGPLEARLARFRAEFDRFRSAVVNEPRGSDALVGALLCAPHRAGCDLGVIFFNNVGFLGMCGHGAIGVVASLAALDRIHAGTLRLDTPVGAVDAELRADGAVSIANVPSRRTAKRVPVKLSGGDEVIGDVAWGGNWFFLADRPELALDVKQIEPLTDFAWRIRGAANAQGFPEVDHVELFGGAPGADGRSFVCARLRPLPCGTGTSASSPAWPRRGARRGRDVGAGERDRQPLPRQLPLARPRARGDRAGDHGRSARDGRVGAAARSARPVLLGDPLMCGAAR